MSAAAFFFSPSFPSSRLVSRLLFLYSNTYEDSDFRAPKSQMGKTEREISKQGNLLKWGGKERKVSKRIGAKNAFQQLVLATLRLMTSFTVCADYQRVILGQGLYCPSINTYNADYKRSKGGRKWANTGSYFSKTYYLEEWWPSYKTQFIHALNF